MWFLLLFGFSNLYALNVFQRQVASSQGVFLILHGLTIAPHKMNELGEMLAGLNYSSVQLSLKGHEAKNPEILVNSLEWEKEFIEAYQVAKKLADNQHKPLYALGFSMGGLMVVKALLEEKIFLERAILFAPALKIAWYAPLIKLIFPFPDSWKVPSFSPPEYRSHRDGIPISFYRAFFDIFDDFQSTLKKMSAEKIKALLNLNTLVFLHPDDELVSTLRIQKWIKTMSLNRWRVEILDKAKSEDHPPFHHLMVNQKSLGLEQWERIREVIKSFLKG